MKEIYCVIINIQTPEECFTEREYFKEQCNALLRAKELSLIPQITAFMEKITEEKARDIMTVNEFERFFKE